MLRTVLAVTLYRCWRPGTFPVLFGRPAVLCGRRRRRPRLCGGSTAAAAARRPRTGRARADGERRRHRVCPSASYAVARARFKESLELVSTAHDRAGARPAASAARRAAARASFFSFRSSLVLVRFRMREGRASDRVVVFVRQTDKHSWRWITGFVRR